MPKVSFDSQDKGDRCLELALAVRRAGCHVEKKMISRTAGTVNFIISTSTEHL